MKGKPLFSIQRNIRNTVYKLIAMLPALVMVLSLAACDGSGSNIETAAPTQTVAPAVEGE